MLNNRKLTKELVTQRFYDSFTNIYGILPNPDKVLRKTGKQIAAYRDLKNDPHVWSCIQSRKSGVLSLGYSILPNGSNSAIVNIIKSIFGSLDIHKIIRDILEATLFGFQPLEIIWEVNDNATKYIFPKQIIAKPQEWFYFDTQNTLRFRRNGELQGEELPDYKILNVQYEQTYLNPYGEALLSKCYWPVIFKNGGLKFWVNFSEKYGMPMLMGQYNRGATSEEIEKLAQELANMTEDSIIVAPEDIDIKLHEATRSSSVSLYKELIRYCNAEISKALLSQTLTTELDMGSYAASQTHFKVRKEVIQADIRLVERTMNEVIKYIMELNFNENISPVFKIKQNDSDNLERVERDVKIAQTGQVKFTKKYWMERYGFKEDDIENSLPHAN
jgi:phage gp29-like protein